VTDDFVRPFQIEASSLRGRLVRLGPGLDRVIAAHGYPDPVATLLGEAVSLAALLAGALKFEGVFTLQTKSDGPVSLLVADVTSAGAVRAYAQYDEARLEAARPGSAPVPRLLGAGYLAFTVDQGEHTERYQGIVALEGPTLADCVHHYFRQSEQIEAALILACSRAGGSFRAGGIMLQRLPTEGGTEGVDSRLSFLGEAAVEAQEDGWRRALALLGSCSPEELLDPDLPADDLLLRLFHEDGVRVYPAHPLEARCRCSRARIESVLCSLPEADIDHIRNGDQVTVTCEFCSTEYRFSDEEIEGLRRVGEA
jgi:molecular chaperone Hsp33